MSRIGRKPIPLPASVNALIEERSVTVEGPKGKLVLSLPKGVVVRKESLEGNSVLLVDNPCLSRKNRGFRGLVRARLANIVKGVLDGFVRKLEISGVGYKAEIKSDQITVLAGYSHPVVLKILPGVKITMDRTQTKLAIEGIDLESVSQMAAKIRSVKEPEPYKGKGIKYDNEVVRRKVGKAGSK
jgi:large subunit ribosomal protein L6